MGKIIMNGITIHIDERKDRKIILINKSSGDVGLIREQAYQKANQIYDNDIPEGVTEQIESELNLLQETKSATVFLIAKQIVEFMRDNGYSVWNCWDMNYSMVAYLLGITEINPYEYFRSKLYIEMHRRKYTYMGLEIDEESLEALSEYLKTNCDIKILDEDDFSYLENPSYYIEVIYDDDLSVLKKLSDAIGIAPEAIPLDDAETFKSLSKNVVLNSIDDLARVVGIFNGAGAYFDNAYDIMKQNNLEVKDLISFREDVFYKLIEYGYEKERAFEISETIRKGKRMTDEQYAEIFDDVLPQWFVDSCKSILYLPSHPHCVSQALIKYRIGYYKTHFPEVYDKIVNFHS